MYALNSNAHVDVLLLDLSKAFDSVPHFRLLSKLESYGISGRILEWIKSFLSNRSQCVFVDSCSSSFKNVLSGVPQGSVLGPILFVIYLNDFFTRLHHTLPECYADDTKLVCSLLQKSFVEVGLDFREVENWSKEWLLQINSQKSFILRFGRNNPLNSYSLNGITIPVSDTITDLGVIIDPSLGFSAHVNHVVNKASSALGWLLRTFSIRNAPLTHLYKSYVLPLLEYNSAFWNPHLLKDIDALESSNADSQSLFRFFATYHIVPD